MIYIDQHDNITTLTPTEGWHYATGYWATTKGDVFNLPEKIAEQSGSLAPENPKERKMVLLALNYAKQRRERSILALQREIANLDKAISDLKNWKIIFKTRLSVF